MDAHSSVQQRNFEPGPSTTKQYPPRTSEQYTVRRNSGFEGNGRRTSEDSDGQHQYSRNGDKSDGRRDSGSASKNVLTIALQKAQSAVLLDSANNLPAAIAAYTQSVRLLAEVMHRCEESLERERERSRRSRDSRESDDPKRRERREKRERLKEDEARRLRVIHDTYADRIKMLKETMDATEASLGASRPMSSATVTPAASQPSSRRRTLDEVTTAPVIQVVESADAAPQHQRQLSASPPASPMDPMFAPDALRPTTKDALSGAGPTTPRQAAFEEDKTPRLPPSESRSYAHDPSEGFSDTGPNGVGLGVTAAPTQRHGRQKSGESITSYHRPTSFFSTLADSNRSSTTQTSLGLSEDGPPAPPPKLDLPTIPQNPLLSASPTIRSPTLANQGSPHRTGLALLSDTFDDEELAIRLPASKRPALQTAHTSPVVPLAIQPPKRSASASTHPRSSISSPPSSSVLSRKASMSAIAAAPSRVPALPPMPTDLIVPVPPVRQPFKLMLNIVSSISQGSYLSPRLYVPRLVWEQPVKLAKLDAKIRVLDEMAIACENGRLDDIERAADSLRDASRKLAVPKDKGGWGNKMLSKGLEKMNTRNPDSLPAYCDSITRSFLAAQVLDRQLAEIGYLAPRERSVRESQLHKLSDFYKTVVCPIVLADVGILLDKYVKKLSGYSGNE